MRGIRRLLIANRGEIACRIARSCRRLGIVPIAVHSEADGDALHVRQCPGSLRIGPAPAAQSYLSIESLLGAAGRAGADAIHPGYGFLSESAAFAQAVEGSGTIWIGPPPAAIQAMGDKLAARRLAREHGIPTLPGYDCEAGDDDEALLAAAEGVGFPLMVKAAAGGGGRGIRLVREADDLPRALKEARREAQSSFGDGRLLLERYLEAARHVEVQVVADGCGAVAHLFERECSIQRRRQKIVEEAPSPAVDAHLRARLGEAAVRVAQLVDYRGVGTVEFLLDPAGDFYFLEMNTRLQVEHPVTEAITGLDLVALQIQIAEGQPLDLAGLRDEPQGHAIEARIYAEDPLRDFAPVGGQISAWDIPTDAGVRVDAGYEAGDGVGVHYDALLAKVIVHGADRRQAVRRLQSALQGAWIAGVTTNLPLLRQIASHGQYQAGGYDTDFLSHSGLPRQPPVDTDAGIIGAVALEWLLGSRPRPAPGGERPPKVVTPGPVCPPPAGVSLPSGWRSWGNAPLQAHWRGPGGVVQTSTVDRGGGQLALTVSQEGRPPRQLELRVLSLQDGALQLAVDGDRARWRIALRRARGGQLADSAVPLEGNDLVYVHTGSSEAMVQLEPRLEVGDAAVQGSGTCVAPMPGTIVEVHVAAGHSLEQGAPLVTLEAMKMQQTLSAPQAGLVSEVLVEPGDAVEDGAVLVILESPGDQP